MIPLEQWICDECGELISEPSHGYLEWTQKNRKRYRFRIVHHIEHSPRKESGRNCYYDSGDYQPRLDISLTQALKSDGIIKLLSFIDLGPLHEYDYSEPGVIDFREWVELFRRLHLPYYEEARIYWTLALDDGYFEGATEIWVYLSDSLKELVDIYKNSEE